MLGAAGELRAHGDRGDDAVRRRIDARDARAARVHHPHRARRDGDADRLRADLDRCAYLVRRRVDARDPVLSGVGEPHAAVAGSNCFGDRDLDSGDDGISSRVDPHQRRLDVAHRPDRAFADRERAASKGSRRTVSKRNPGDDACAARQRTRVAGRSLRTRRRTAERRVSPRGSADARHRIRGEAAGPDRATRRHHDKRG